MRSFRIFDHRVGSIIAVAALLFATVVPTLVAAAQLTERSIQLSTSSKNASGVSYQVNFTPVANAGAFVVDFCTNTPLYGEDCTAPSGLTVASAASTTSGFTGVAVVTNGGTNNTVRVTGTMTAATPVTVDITGIHNPTNAGTLYARIVTFDTEANADDYVSNPGTTNAGAVDNGGVAMSITDTIGVTGAVLESMTFCVSGAAITDPSCGTTLTAPTLKLGQDVGGGVFALATTVSSGSIYTQLSTNAASGAIVRLKSNAVNCGGLKLIGSTDANNCFIQPSQNTDVTDNGGAKFGVKTATAAGVGSSNGTLRPYDSGSGAYYSNTAYRLKGATDNLSGVTSIYGDPFLDTNGAPVNNMGMQLTFGAAIANDTPAGLYSADLSLIATGKF